MSGVNRTPSLLGSSLASAASLLALAELHPPPGLLMGRRRKPPSSQTQTAAAAGFSGCNRGTEYTFVLLESCHKALELRIAKTEPLIIQSLVPTQEPAGQVSPISMSSLRCQARSAPESLPPKFSSRSHSPPASTPSLPKRDRLWAQGSRSLSLQSLLYS